MKAVIYARFSSDNQREESITAQVRACNEYAGRRGFSVVKVYTDEARSATTDDRPGFLKMIKDIKSGRMKVDFLLVHKLDRFARNRYTAPFISGSCASLVFAWNRRLNTLTTARNQF